MCLKLHEDAIKAKAQKKKGRRNSRRSPTPQDEPTDADVEAEIPGEGTGGGDLASLAAAMSRESPSDTSRSRKHGKSSKPSVISRASHGPKDLPTGDDLDELSETATQARTEMVQQVLEGLREEAFELARDIGVDVLTQPGGLRKFVEKLRDNVFRRASEEARELFRVGQKPGSLARQNGESMLSYVSRRRRWWNLLETLDGSIELSEPMRVKLLLELSGLSRQEIIVIKACAPDAKSFESVAATLVEQYSGVHLREGRSLGQPNLCNSGNLQTRSSRPSGYRPKGKGPIRLTLPMPGTMRRMIVMRRIRTRRRISMKPPTKPLMKNPRQGTPKTQKATVKILRTTSYPSPKQLPLTVLRNSRSPQKLDMLYSYSIYIYIHIYK